ncbi:MAG: hypothetical protein ABIP12_02170, partial [Terriglobales bacterium]
MAEMEQDEAALAAKFEAEHAAEIAAEKDKKFELTGATADEIAPLVAVAAVPVAAAVPAAAAPERISPLQKISRLSVGERVKLA